jgi:TolB-like protein/Tfp pilus assembly protein PilF
MDPGAPPAVFLSYARDDAAPAQRVAEALRSQGIEVWFDQNELRGGDAWDQKIRQQIRGCTLFVAIVSRHTQERSEGYFRLEWRLAVERTHLMAEGTPFLVPVVVDETAESGSVVPSEFMRVQWMRLQGGLPTPAFVEQLKRLVLAPRRPAPPVAAEARAQPASPPGAKSVAVLAFANLSQDAENEFFSDGISEELLNLVSKIPGIRVVARTSAFSFKGKSAQIHEIAGALGVAHVVEGSVRKAGSRVRIVAKLVSADGFQVWSETFDRELKDIFALQDEIAGLIARSLQLKLGGEARPTHAVDPEAHRLVLEGRHFWAQRTAASLDKAERSFRKALEISPNFAIAHGGLADVMVIRVLFGFVMEPERQAALIESAKAEVEIALSLDPTQGEVLAVKAFIAYYDRRFVESDALFIQAIGANPSYVFAHLWRGHLMTAVGRLDEAFRSGERALALDPLSFITTGFYSLILIFGRRYREALDLVERALELASANSVPMEGLRSYALLKLGRRDEAVASARAALAMRYPPSTLYSREEAVHVLTVAGSPGEALGHVNRLLETIPAQSAFRASLYNSLGMPEETLASIGVIGSVNLGKFNFHPLWDGLREDPRFRKRIEDEGFGEELVRSREQLARLAAATRA